MSYFDYSSSAVADTKNNPMMNNIIDFLYSISEVSLFIIICIATLSIGIIFLFLIRKIIPNKFQKEELGSVGNFISGSIAGLHAISAGFILVYLVGNFNQATNIVTNESIMLRKFINTVAWLPERLQPSIYTDITNYIEDIVNKEWALMNDGQKIDDKTLSHLQSITNVIQQYHDNDPMQLFIKQKIFNDVQELDTIRHRRIQTSYASLNVEYWFVILLTALINLFFICLLGNKLYFHNISVMFACITSASIIFLLIILDRPFRGNLSASQDEFIKTISYIQTTFDQKLFLMQSKTH